ncbi:glycoside hydrolase family 51 protein [Amniculicola lignicola CBS 123094]|uniref:non-reducing end alpha-L-arabinofuranosidase n=1 Tax=Amniculicola lignicola CBS 123094 TaxID=1392246 RepID=A0A6A5WPB5_9PLEO|nr:glycoside hydrolase family 51 protein [Amniculicola lignicola CBS 123094]
MNTLLLVFATLSCVSALDINVANTRGNATSRYQYGIMFEDINHSGDGGIYAGLIRNRAFQGSSVRPPTISPWTSLGVAALSLKNLPLPLSSALPTSLNVASSNGTIGISNPGYWGIDASKDKYAGSFWVKGDYTGIFEVQLWNYLSNTTVGSAQVESNATNTEWKEHAFELVPDNAPGNVNNTFALTLEDYAEISCKKVNGSLDLHLISLFPPTYNDRPNGMRIDLMEILKDLRSSFLRFPGLIEYLHWCDDLDMEPALAVWAGFYLSGPVLTPEALQPYINDALAELEFITGPVSSPQGALRASLGYPNPWAIRYVEVGNEDNLGGGGSSYETYRFQLFKDAINKKYPEIAVFASTSDYDFLEQAQYTRPDYFVGQFGFFDDWTPGFRTMIGTLQGGGADWKAARLAFPYWIGTAAEAVFLIGAERNADKIWGAAYWAPDLISFSADISVDVLSTSYHAIQLLSTHRISTTLPIASPAFGPAYYVAGYSNETGSYLLKTAVYNSTEPVSMSVMFEGVGEGAEGTLTVLTASGVTAYNNVGVDVVRKGVVDVVAGSEGLFVFELPDLSVSVLEIKA